MTVGEKIQFLRKRAGLSQEELGQQLLVSRQTVSLWETGQTLPTVDNLSRLRTIFGVSVDELLCEGEGTPSNVALQARDGSSFLPYSLQELRAITRYALLPCCVWIAALLALLLCGIIALFSLPVSALIWLVAGMLLCFLSALPLLIIRIVRVCGRIRLLRATRYCCEMIDGEVHFALKEGEQVCESCRAALSEVRLIRQGRRIVFLSLRGRRVYIGRDAWEQNEELRATVRRIAAAPTRTKRSVSVSFLLAAGVCFLAALGVTIPLAVCSVPRAWQVITVVGFAAAIPALACVAVGLLLRYAYKGWKRNVLAGALLGAVLLTGATTALVRSWPRPVQEVERRIGVQVPSCESISTRERGRVSDELFVYYEAELYFDEKHTAEWEQDLIGGMNACEALPAALSPYLPSPEFGRGATCFLLFDVDEGRAAEALVGSGYHEYILFVYFPKENVMRIAKGNYFVAE